MVKKKVVSNRNVLVKALINLKYDKDIVKIGEEVMIRTEDVEFLVGNIDVIKTVETDNTSTDNTGDTATTENTKEE